MAEPESGVLDPIAVVGLACRFPGARNPQEFWRNLCRAVESVTFFSDRELLEAGVPQRLLKDPRYVKAKAELEGIELFDAAFFGFTPRQAELLDPQSRLFLECCWQALEDAGYDPLNHSGRTGVLAGAGSNFYLIDHLLPNSELVEAAGGFRVLMGNELDSTATLASYKLNLTGPSIALNTACSTSLVAVAMACQSLTNYQCDLALAGGVSLESPVKEGYFYTPGGIDSPDGHCRAFDEKAAGTVFGSGAGVVALKRLEDALADGDAVRAVIRGWAVNNDGALKVGYTAPGRDGQAEVIAEALELAGVSAETISYVEAHGTGTELGDPIELSALSQAFRLSTSKSGFCALGSVKTNIGHLDTAAGAAGLIKTVLALQGRQLPPSLNFHNPNPRIDFESSPFYVNSRLQPWQTPDGMPRRAGVSSFGIGGTNAHVVVVEAPPGRPVRTIHPHPLLVISARSQTALDESAQRLADHFRANPEINLASACHTLQSGRRPFSFRRSLVCSSPQQAADLLDRPRRPGVFSGQAAEGDCPHAFLLPGQGTPPTGLADDLYRWAPAFRKSLDSCSQVLSPVLGFDLRELLCPGKFAASRPDWQDADGRQRILQRTEYAQPTLFALQYSLAQMWMTWGIRPGALLGHSLGEWVAAALSGVFSLQDALRLVAKRGRLMQGTPAGAMLAASLDESGARRWTGQDVWLAAINGPSQCVFSGPEAAMVQLEGDLAASGVRCQKLPVQQAFHSACMNSVVRPFAQRVKEVKRRAPRIPLISGGTGDWLTGAQATQAQYWANQLRQTVRFGDGLGCLLASSARVLLEVGPADSLCALARRHPQRLAQHQVLATHSRRSDSVQAAVVETLGRLWLCGAQIDWEAFHEGEQLNRVSLPTYPFQRRRYWIDPPSKGKNNRQTPQPTGQKAEDGTDPAGNAEGRPTLDSAYRAPADPIEEGLADVWQELLGIEPVGVKDDFFELGGDSLAAVQMSALLQRRMGIEVPSRLLLASPTIAALARHVQSVGKLPSQEPLPASLVELQPGNDRLSPLFLVHPLGGHVFVFRHLARCLGADRPVLAFQARGVDGEAEPHSQVGAMAADYLQALHSNHPQGDVCLTGYSFGGLVAFEMARRLLEQGRTSRLLALIDSPGPGPVSGINLAASEDPLMQAHTQALESYSPESYAGRLVYFRARQRERSDPGEPERFWMQRCAEGEVVQVDGDHFTLIQPPHAEQLAQLLRKYLT